MTEAPKDGTPILAYVITRRLKGWMVIQYTRDYWQTIPGKYGVDRVVCWTALPKAPDTETKFVEGGFNLHQPQIHESKK